MPQRLCALLLLVTAALLPITGRGQLPSVTPEPKGYRQAVSFDLAGNTPFIGASYHLQFIRFAPRSRNYSGAIELSAGLGYVPGICLFTSCPGSFSTHHALLLLYGRGRWQAEAGYTGFYYNTQFFIWKLNGYMPAPAVGIRYHTSRNDWLFRLYMAGSSHAETNTSQSATGDLVLKKTTYLMMLPGFSVGKRF
ncbi:hypothetical protein GCM10023187_00590 [Nibrella viscosa]|uniref:DUF3575 domain-containing protein n=1 Tax=Nibrella viscosa TaxID=1084524 RepID=A0ABP8JQM8_9BACT